jgi:hypothetical protein
MDITTLSWMDLFNSTVLPFLFMILLSLVVIYAVKKSRSRVCATIRTRKYTLTPLGVNENTMMARRATIFTLGTKLNDLNNKKDDNNFVVVSKNKSSTKSRDRKFALATVALNVIFLLLNLPVTVYYQYTSILNIEMDDILFYLFVNLWYLYYAIGFYAQMVVNSAFRNEFFALLKLKPMNGSGLSIINTATKERTEN